MNPLLSRLQPYPFARLKQLFAGVTPNPAYRPISLGIGEPKHATPPFIKDALIDGLAGLASYPATAGLPALREAVAQHVRATRGVRCQPAQVIITDSTAQSLDLIARLLCDPGDAVWIENPCY